MEEYEVAVLPTLLSAKIGFRDLWLLTVCSKVTFATSFSIASPTMTITGFRRRSRHEVERGWGI